MNKTIAIGETAQGALKGHKARIETLKKIYTRYFSKRYESQICSILDFANYIYYDDTLAYGQDDEIRAIIDNNMERELGFKSGHYFDLFVANMENMPNANLDLMSKEQICKFFTPYVKMNGVGKKGNIDFDNFINENIDAIKDEYLSERDAICKYIALLKALPPKGNIYKANLRRISNKIVGELCVLNYPNFDNLDDEVIKRLKIKTHKFGDISDDSNEEKNIEFLTGKKPTEETSGKYRKMMALAFNIFMQEQILISRTNQKLFNSLLNNEELKDLFKGAEKFSQDDVVEMSIHMIADMIFDANASCDSFYAYEVDFDNLNLMQNCCIRYPLNLIVLLHENNHMVSSNMASKIVPGKNYLFKIGLGVENRNFEVGGAMNEIFTEYLAQDIYSTLSNEEKLELGGNTSDQATSHYKNYFPLLKSFFAENKDLLIRAYMGWDYDALFNKFGETNYINFLQNLDELLNFDLANRKKLDLVLKFRDKADDENAILSEANKNFGGKVEVLKKYLNLVNQVDGGLKNLDDGAAELGYSEDELNK